MRILIILILLSFTTLANADLIVKGRKVIFTGDALTNGVTLTESEIAPANPALNDVWRCITDGTIYVWNGTAWVVKNYNVDVKQYVQDFKTALSQVQDPAIKQCLKMLGKIILRLYLQDLQ